MQSNLLGTIRTCFLTLTVPLAVFVVSISSAQANVTFKFEGELTHVDNPLSGTFSTGDKFTGTYTFDETLSHPENDFDFASFEDSISAMSFATKNYKALATNGDIGQDFDGGPFYYVDISPLSGSSINNFALDEMILSWTATNSYDPFVPATDPGYDPYTPPWVSNFNYGEFDFFDADGNLVYRGYENYGDDFGLVGNPNQPLFFEGGTLFSPDGQFDLSFSDGQSIIRIQGDLNSVTVVPIPTAIWLFGSSLLGLIGIAKRKLIS